ncbi:uncharacterized protein TNCV_3402721 [Trichonephila clavipes]|nr:uncharacterized protein TNCV_3402721 [Trichonephila clavipes]
MDVCKCIVSVKHRGTLNSLRVTRPHVRLVGGEEKWVALDHPQSILPQNWIGTKENSIVICLLLKATVNDNRTISPLTRMNFAGLDQMLLSLRLDFEWHRHFREDMEHVKSVHRLPPPLKTLKSFQRRYSGWDIKIYVRWNTRLIDGDRQEKLHIPHELKKFAKYHQIFLSFGGVQLKMSRQPTHKITPQRYLQASK